MANNDDFMINALKDIYPKELVLVPDDSDGLSAPFLDVQLVTTNGVVSTSIFDKRDAFDFQIVNFPTLTGNIPSRVLMVSSSVKQFVTLVLVHILRISRRAYSSL